MEHYLRYKLVRPADGAIFIYDSYNYGSVERVAGVFLKWEVYEEQPYRFDRSLVVRRTFWELDRHCFYNWQYEHQGDDLRRRLAELEVLQGQVNSRYTAPRRLVEYVVVDGDFIGVVEA